MADEKSADQAAALDPGVTFFNTAFAQFQATAWSLQLVFGDMGKAPSGQPIEIPRMVVGMPWPLAKLVAQVLAETISQFEDKEGPINLPKSVADQFRQQMEAYRAAAQKQA